MLADQLRHLEHADRLLAGEHRLQLLVSIDVPLVLRILEAIALDVGPELLGHFSARQRLVADHLAECGTWRHGFHECGIGFPCGFLLRCLGHQISLFSCRGAPPPRPVPSPPAAAWRYFCDDLLSAAACRLATVDYRLRLSTVDCRLSTLTVDLRLWTCDCRLAARPPAHSVA